MSNANQIRQPCPISGQSVAEEWANSITHALGLIGSVIGFFFLLASSFMYGNGWQRFSFTVYGTTLVLMYLASTWYHACSCPIRKSRLRVFDHVCIYLLIAGSYTPFTLGPLKGAWGWALFGIIWILAGVGISIKMFRYKISALFDVLLYLGMGWLVVLAAGPLSRVLSSEGLTWMACGGIAYTVGVGFYVYKLPFGHAIWHLFVLAGSVCHYWCIAFHLMEVPT